MYDWDAEFIPYCENLDIISWWYELGFNEHTLAHFHVRELHPRLAKSKPDHWMKIGASQSLPHMFDRFVNQRGYCHRFWIKAPPWMYGSDSLENLAHSLLVQIAESRTGYYFHFPARPHVRLVLLWSRP
jgi:hypothetical protein